MRLPGYIIRCEFNNLMIFPYFQMDPSLWRSMSFVQVRVSAAQLAGIARRQPLSLGLEWCHLARRQLAW